MARHTTLHTHIAASNVAFDITYRLVEISLGCFPNFGSCAFNTSRSTLRETGFHASEVADIWALFLQMSHPHKIILHCKSTFEQTKTQNLLQRDFRCGSLVRFLTRELEPIDVVEASSNDVRVEALSDISEGCLLVELCDSE